MLTGRYECRCPAFWNGVDCEKFDNDFTGGIGKPTTLTTTAVPIDIQKQQCIINQCNIKAGNGRCDVSTTCFKKKIYTFQTFTEVWLN